MSGGLRAAARVTGLGILLLLGVGLGVGAPGSASAAAPRARVAEVPRLPAQARLAGPLASGRRLGLTVALASRDPLGLQTLATAVATPGSPEYRHYLSVGRFADRFGATPAHVAAVTRTLRRAGLQVAPADPNRLVLGVSGSATQVQAAFATRLARVRLVGGRVAYAPRTTPTLPAGVAQDVDGVVGLDSLTIPRPDDLSTRRAPRASSADPAFVARPHVATGGAQPCAQALDAQAALAASQEGFGGYTADEIAAAYNFSGLYAAGDLGAGQTVALYELETLHPADARRFQTCYGATGRITYHDVDHPRRTATDEEAGLDADQVIALAPAANIEVYQAPDTVAAGLREYSRIVSADTARTVSVSWGGCEKMLTDGGHLLALVKAESTLFQEAAVQGQSIIAASGDTGSAGCYGGGSTDRTLSVQDPASQPFATSVGGTSLYEATAQGPAPWNPNLAGEPAPQQSVWNDGRQTVGHTTILSATSGGLSTVWRMPRYQRRAASALRVRNRNSSGRPCHVSGFCREVPDVSADGDPDTGYDVYVSAPGGATWATEGGTSAAAPLWAAISALADASPACRDAALGFENPSLYTLAARSGYLADVRLASPFSSRADNDALGVHHGAYPVTAGYDLTTGLGTPDVAAVALGLCGLRAPVYTVHLVAPRIRRAFLRTATKLRVRGTDSGGLALRYRARGLPEGLSISRRGMITGRARRLGRRSVTVTAVDRATNAGTVTFRLRVVDP